MSNLKKFGLSRPVVWCQKVKQSQKYWFKQDLPWATLKRKKRIFSKKDLLYWNLLKVYCKCLQVFAPCIPHRVDDYSYLLYTQHLIWNIMCELVKQRLYNIYKLWGGGFEFYV